MENKITFKTLDNESMQALGFVEGKFYWELIYPLGDYVSYRAIINKDENKDSAVIVFDELFGRMFPFTDDPIVGKNTVAAKVDKVSTALQLVGVISGYIPGNPKVFSRAPQVMRQ